MAKSLLLKIPIFDVSSASVSCMACCKVSIKLQFLAVSPFVSELSPFVLCPKDKVFFTQMSSIDALNAF